MSLSADLLQYAMYPIAIVRLVLWGTAVAVSGLITEVWMYVVTKGYRHPFVYSDRLKHVHYLMNRLAMFIQGVWVLRVVGREQLRLPARVVSNHPFVVDALTLIAALRGRVKFISKASVAKYPFISSFCKANGTRFVQRNDEKSCKDIKTFMQTDRDEGTALVVFSEGTNDQQRRLWKFRWGAFEDDQPVTPMTVKYNMWPPEDPALFPLAKAAGQDQGASDTRDTRIPEWREMLFLFSRVWTTVDVHIHPQVRREADQSVEAFAAQVNHFMAKQVGLPVHDYPSTSNRKSD